MRQRIAALRSGGSNNEPRNRKGAKTIAAPSETFAYRTVLFDLDGTLLDTLGDLAAAVNHVLERHGYPPVTVDDTRRFVGSGVARLMECALPDGSANPLFSRCLTEFQRYYSQHMDVLTKPYLGVVELLERLQTAGVQTAVVSNKFDTAVKMLADKYFGTLIGSAVGESDQLPRKPAPEMVFKALELLGAGSDAAVLVGDSDIDILTAANAGMDCIAVTWGFRGKEYLIRAGAAALADSPAELLRMLLNK